MALNHNFSSYHQKPIMDLRSMDSEGVDDGLICFSKHHSKTISRFIEFSCAVLVAFMTLSIISFLSLRPALKEIRSEARVQWDGMVNLARERNDLIQGVVQVLRGFGVIQNKWGEKILEERSILLRAADPDAIISSIDETDQRLAKLAQLADSSAELRAHPTFIGNWARIDAINRDLKLKRMNYNEKAKMYNSLLTPFPQNMLAAIFGFVPLNKFPFTHVDRRGNA